MERAPRLVSIVVPTYNERQNLPRLVAAIEAALPWPHETIIVDDSSPDGTGDIARDLARTHPVRLVSRPAKSGIGSAYRDGYATAQGDVIVQMDADLSHDPAHLPALVDAVMRGADVAIGSRYVSGGAIVGWSPYRHVVSAVGNGLARGVLRIGARDVTTGYRAYSASAARTIQDVHSDGYAFEVEALHVARRAGLHIVEVPIIFENRTVGRSKLSAAEYVRFLRTLARLGLGRPRPARARPARAS